MEVIRDVVLPLGPDEAWELVTDPEAWLARASDLEIEPGAEGVLVLHDGEERRTVVEDVDPGERLSFWWDDGSSPSTRVELTLRVVAGGTRVTVVESGFAVGPVALALGGLGARIPAYA